MKFKMQLKQNQLIERITNQNVVVWIEIAQQTHVSRAFNYHGIIVGDPLFPSEITKKDFFFQWNNKLLQSKNLGK